jgi:hypothetical protein
MATRRELSSHTQVPAFFLASLRVHRQICRTDGAIGVSLIAKPLRRTFFTLSAWRDDEAIAAMIGTEPHRSVMETFRRHTSDTVFVSWKAPAGQTPDWVGALRRLDQHVRRREAGSAP